MRAPAAHHAGSPAATARGSGLLLLFVVFLVWPAALVDTSGPSMADSTLLAAIRLVDEGTWTLTDETDPAIAFRTTAFDISVHDGRIYSGVGPGASVIAAAWYVALRPLFALFGDGVIRNDRVLGYYLPNARALGVDPPAPFKSVYLLQIGLVWTLMAPLFASLLVRVHRLPIACGTPPSRALLTVTALGFGTMLLGYSSMYSRQGLATLLAGHAIMSLVRRARGASRAGGARVPVIALAGLLCGMAVSVDYPMALPVGLTLAFLLPLLGWKERLGALLPAGLVLFLTGLYHLHAFGSFLTTPYHHRFWLTHDVLAGMGVDLGSFQSGALLGIGWPDPLVALQLCFGLFKGLFVYSPVLLVALAGHVAGLRPGSRSTGHEEAAGSPRLHVLSFAVFAACLAFNASIGSGLGEHAHHYWGGLSGLWGPRYLLVTLPFLAWGLVRIDLDRRALRLVVIATLAVSGVFNLAGALYARALMSVFAFAPELSFPPGHVLRLLFTEGPRLTILDAYGAPPLLQSACLGALVLSSVVGLALVRGRQQD